MESGHRGLPIDPLDLLRQRRSAKWQTYANDVLPLTVAEMDVNLAPPVAEVLAEAVRRSDTGYGRAAPDLGRAVARFAARRWSWDVDPAQVTGGDRRRSRRGRTAPGPDPAGRRGGDQPAGVPAVLRLGARGRSPAAGGAAGPRRGDGWRLDLAALERAFATHPAAYVLCNPHNPVGRVHCPDELAALVRLARIYRVTLISDEIHGPLVLPGATFTPLLDRARRGRGRGHGLSASKAWNLAGLKCAAVVTASPQLAAVRGPLPAGHRWRIGHFGVHRPRWPRTPTGEPWLDELLVTLDQRRAQLGRPAGRQRLPQVSWHPPEATFLAWLDCSAIGPDDTARDRFLDRGRVALEPGLRFGAPGSGYARLNFGTSEEILDEAIGRMAKALT